MWSKIKNLFSGKENPQTFIPDEDKNKTHFDKDSIYPNGISVESEPVYKTGENYNNIKPLSTGLALGDAIAMLIYEYGYDIMLSGNIYNAISDYGAFQNNIASKTIFKTIESEGIFSELLNLTTNDNLDNNILKYTQILTSNFGYNSEVVKSIIFEILFGLKLISESECKSRIPHFNNNDADLLIDSSVPKSSDTFESSSPTDPYKPNQGYKYPSIDVLPANNTMLDCDAELEETKERIIWVLASQGITATSIKGIYGPRVSMYEIDIDPRKLSKVNRNEKEILSSLTTSGGRILNPIPGKMALGIEVPNKVEYEINLRDVLDQPGFTNSKYELPIALGIDSCGNTIIKDLEKLPHLLICGAMQQGKTSLLREILASLLVKKTSYEIKFTLIDTCSLELQNFKNLGSEWMAQSDEDKYLSVVYGSDVGLEIMRKYIIEIESRKILFEDANVSNIKEYNENFCNKMLDLNKGHHFMPYLILVCDEIAPLVSSNPKEFESIINSLISNASNTGIHCIFTTKHTSSDILTPLIRSTFPVRVSFKIHIPNESKLVLGNYAATNLLTNGDAVILENGFINRFQCPKCDSKDIQSLLDECGKLSLLAPSYTLPDFVINLNPPMVISYDPLFEEVARYISMSNQASTTSLQRRYSIGFARAGKIMDQLEATGIVGPAIGGKPRNVLMNSIEVESILNSLRN